MIPPTMVPTTAPTTIPTIVQEHMGGKTEWTDEDQLISLDYDRALEKRNKFRFNLPILVMVGLSTALKWLDENTGEALASSNLFVEFMINHALILWFVGTVFAYVWFWDMFRKDDEDDLEKAVAKKHEDSDDDTDAAVTKVKNMKAKRVYR